MPALRKRWTDADRIKVLEKLTKQAKMKKERLEARRASAARKLEKQRRKSELQRQRDNLDLQKLERETKIARARAVRSRAVADRKAAETDVWKQRYRKVGTVISPYAGALRKTARGVVKLGKKAAKTQKKRSKIERWP